MKCKRLNEVIELLQPAWQKEPELNLMQFLQKLAKEAGLPDGVLNVVSGFGPEGGAGDGCSVLPDGRLVRERLRCGAAGGAGGADQESTGTGHGLCAVQPGGAEERRCCYPGGNAGENRGREVFQQPGVRRDQGGRGLCGCCGAS